MSQNSLESPQKPKILAIDDHELILNGTINVLKQKYPEAEILTARTAQEAREQMEKQPNLVVMDLSIPEKTSMTAQTDIGIQLLQQLMKQYPTLNLMVQSSYVKALVKLKHEIDIHQGGFTIADKSISELEMLTRVDWALQGITHTKDLKIGIEIKPEWLEVLRLAFEEGLQDKAIAKKMNVSDRMVRHYWTKVQDVLEVYPEEDKNLRVLTLIRAREKGLLD
jgi:DNA-binding NarL/FixJ family response regulator